MNVRMVVPAHLHLVCPKCLREAGFEADTEEQAGALAKKAGWTASSCPRCAPRELFHCPCGSKRNLKPGDSQKYCPVCETVAAA